MLKGFENGASHFMGAFWVEPEGRAHLLGIMQDMKGKVPVSGICRHRGPLGKPGEGACVPGTLRDQRKGLWKRSLFQYGIAARGTWRESCLLVTLNSMQMKVLEKSISLHWSTVGGSWSQSSFTGDFETMVRYCFIKRPFLLETSGDT